MTEKILSETLKNPSNKNALLLKDLLPENPKYDILTLFHSEEKITAMVEFVFEDKEPFLIDFQWDPNGKLTDLKY